MNSIFRSMITNQDVTTLSDTFPNGGRYCMHKSLEEQLHVMLIYMEANNHYPKHKHTNTEEFYIVLDGDMQVDVWNKFDVCSTISMSTNGGLNSMSIVIEKNTWHSMTSGPSGVKFFEVRSGPFLKENTLFEN